MLNETTAASIVDAAVAFIDHSDWRD